MTRFALLLVLLPVLTLFPASAFGQEVGLDSEISLSLYGGYDQRDNVPMADITPTPTRMPGSGESKGVTLKEGGPRQIHTTRRAQSMHAYSGAYFVSATVAAGQYDIIHSPDTRDGGGPYLTGILRAEWEVTHTDQDETTGRRVQLYAGPIVLGNIFQYTERNWESTGGLVGAGISATIVHTDGFVEEEDDNHFGLFILNASLMFAYGRQEGETKYDDFELKYDTAYGVRAEIDFRFYGTRILLSKTRYDLGGKDYVMGITGFFTGIQVTGFGFLPVSDDRKDSLVGQTSKGPSQINGLGRIRLDIFTFDISFFGTRLQTTFTAGLNVRYQERLMRDGKYAGAYDPGVEGLIQFTLSDNIFFGVGADLGRKGKGGRQERFVVPGGYLGVTLSF